MKNMKYTRTAIVAIIALFAICTAFVLWNQTPKETRPNFEVKWPTAKEMVVPEPQSNYCLTHECKG